jgi:aerobic-type carbon monoxide dehydrogenase small subunit (CoxS/CutS family)
MKLNVNGATQTVPDDYASDPLLWSLRDALGLTGTHYGCGIGKCGSCMVLMDGAATRSCQTPTAQAIGAITTIEGLATGSGAATTLHIVQQAFLEFPLQCMWCLPGHVMTAVAMLETNPTPSSAEIESSIAENLCRCGGYNQIRKAIARATEVIEAKDQS